MKNLDSNVKKVNKYIKRIAKGDMSAIEGIYYDFGRLFLAYAKYYLYDKSLAEDLLSDVFCKLIEKSQQFIDNKNGLNWIIKIIKNEAINYNIKNSKYYDVDSIEGKEDICSVFFGLEATEDRIILQTALESLSNIDKTILYDKYWMGLTVREIANKRNMPASTVQNNIKRILKELNEKIEKKQ